MTLKQKETDNKAVKLTPDTALQVLNRIPYDMLQGRRMFEYLSQRPESPTGYVAQHCSIGNLSDVAHYVNPHIYKFGLIIGCDKPRKAIINKFGEASNQFLWSVYQIPSATDTQLNDMPQAANDEEFNSPVDKQGINNLS